MWDIFDTWYWHFVTLTFSPSYRRKVESPYYQIPNMSRAHVRGKAGTNMTSDLYVSSGDEDMNYIMGERLSTRTGKIYVDTQQGQK